MIILRGLSVGDAAIATIAIEQLAEIAPSESAAAILYRLSDALAHAGNASALEVAIVEAARTWALADVASDSAAGRLSEIVRAQEDATGAPAYRIGTSGQMLAMGSPGEHREATELAIRDLELTADAEQSARRCLHDAAYALVAHESERRREIAADAAADPQVS